MLKFEDKYFWKWRSCVNLSVTVNTDRNSPNYGQLEGETIEAKGIFYDEDSSVEFVEEEALNLKLVRTSRKRNGYSKYRKHNL